MTRPLAQTARRRARASKKKIHGHILARHGGITANEEGHYRDRLPAAQGLHFGVRKLIPTTIVERPKHAHAIFCLQERKDVYWTPA